MTLLALQSYAKFGDINLTSPVQNYSTDPDAYENAKDILKNVQQLSQFADYLTNIAVIANNQKLSTIVVTTENIQNAALYTVASSKASDTITVGGRLFNTGRVDMVAPNPIGGGKKFDDNFTTALYDATDINLISGTNIDVSKIPDILDQVRTYIAQQKSMLPKELDGGLQTYNGAFFVNGDQAVAGEIAMSVLYKNANDINTQISTYMADMALRNQKLSDVDLTLKGLKSLSSINRNREEIKLAIVAYFKSNNVTGSDADITARVTDVLHTADENLKLAMGTDTAGSKYSPSYIANTLLPKLHQYSSTLSSDNQVLQQNLNRAVNNRTAMLEALSNLTQGWLSTLKSLVP